MKKYKFFVSIKHARSRYPPADIAVDPFPQSKFEVADAAKDFYSLWFGKDWDTREVIRFTDFPYESSYYLTGYYPGEAKNDAELWLVVGSPTKGMILLTTDPNTKTFLSQNSSYTSAIFVIDLIGREMIWFTFWRKEALEHQNRLVEVRTPRYRRVYRPVEIKDVDVGNGIKGLIIVDRRSRTRISFTFKFDRDERHKLSEEGIKKLEKLVKWIFDETIRIYGEEAAYTLEIGYSPISIHINKLPKILYDQVIKHLKKIATEELVPRGFFA